MKIVMTSGAVGGGTDPDFLEELHAEFPDVTFLPVADAEEGMRLIRDADAIVVLDNGRVLEMGQHQELLARNGTYSRLYAINYGLESPTVPGDSDGIGGDATFGESALPHPAD